eukprot:14031641-Alexandrium_andersonii.AAC.1
MEEGWDAEIAAWFLEKAGAPRWFEEDREAAVGRVRAVGFEDDRPQWPVARWRCGRSVREDGEGSW